MKKILIPLVLCLLVLLSACNAFGNTAPSPTSAAVEATGQPTLETATDTAVPPTATATVTPAPATATATATPAAYGPENFPANINPLTGLAASVEALQRRPIGIKINIFPREQYRPAWGLALADIVYEYYHNDGYTRFHAIYLGNDFETVGAIRSGRLLDVALVQMYKSIFVYGGADQRIENKYWNSDFADRLVREGTEILCPAVEQTPLCRYDPSGKGLLLADTALVHKYIQDKGVDDSPQNLSGMSFDEKEMSGGKPATQVFVRYSSDVYTRWDYNTETHLYERQQDAVQDVGAGEEYTPLADRDSEQQVTAANVVILFASHEDILPSSRQEIIDIKLEGSGKALAFRDGQLFEVLWNRPTNDAVLYLTNADGTRFAYRPGVTWYQVMGLNSTSAPLENGGWRFTFIMP